MKSDVIIENEDEQRQAVADYEHDKSSSQILQWERHVFVVTGANVITTRLDVLQTPARHRSKPQIPVVNKSSFQQLQQPKCFSVGINTPIINWIIWFINTGHIVNTPGSQFWCKDSFLAMQTW